MGDSGIEHYKRMAEQCDRKAEAFPDTEEKKYFKELARQWRELAKRAERAHDARNRQPDCIPPAVADRLRRSARCGDGMTVSS